MGKVRIRAIAILVTVAFVALAIAIRSATHADAVQAWPVFHHDGQNTGLSPYDTSATKGSMDWKWQVKTGLAVTSSPVMGTNRTIYAGSTDGNLYAINSLDGSVKWKYSTSGTIADAPAIDANGFIYFSAEFAGGSIVFAIEDGLTIPVVLWKLSLFNVTSAPAVGPDGTIYVGTKYGPLYAIYPGTGKVKWHFRTGGEVDSSPAFSAEGYVIIGSADGHLYAVNPENGKPLWQYPKKGKPLLGAVVSSAAIGADGTIYAGSDDNNLYAIYPNGTQKWKFATGGPVKSSPAIGDYGTIYVGSGDNNLYAINSDGTKHWSFATTGIVVSSPAIGADGAIYVGSNDNNLYSIEANGTQKWKFATGGQLESSPAIGPSGEIYVGSNDGNLYRLGTGGGPVAWPTDHHDLAHTSRSQFNTSANPGAQKWGFPTSLTVAGVWSEPAIGANGVIYFGDNADNFYAVNPDGTQGWQVSGVGGPPALSADGTTVYAGAIGGLDAIYVGAGPPPAGTVLWNFPFTADSNFVTTSPAVGADGTIYLAADDFNLYAINPDGSPKWSYSPGTYAFRGSPAIGPDGAIYVGSDDFTLYKVMDAGTSASVVWQAGGICGLSSGAVHTPTISADGSTVYFSDAANCLHAVSSATGVDKWTTNPITNPQLPLPCTVVAAPSIGADGTIYQPCDDGNLYAITDNGTSGSILWTYQTGLSQQLSSAAIGAEGAIYFEAARDGLLRALNPPASGSPTPPSLKWGFATGGDPGANPPVPAIGNDGTIYVGSPGASFLYAINTAPPATPTPQATPTPVAATVTVSPKSLSFGLQPHGSTVEKYVKVSEKNSATVPVLIEGITVTGSAYALGASSTCTVGSSLSPGHSCSIAIAFTPPAATKGDSDTGELVVYTNTQSIVPLGGVVPLKGGGK